MVAMALGLQQDHCYTQSMFQAILQQENVMKEIVIACWESLSGHNLSII